MNTSDENNPNIAKPTGFQEMGSRNIGQEINRNNNRRALNVLNHNFMESQPYPCVVNKRSLSENHGVCERNGRRPITRKFAAQLSSSHQHCIQENKKQKPSNPSTNGFGDCIFIDAEEEIKPPADHPEPMFLEQTEQMEVEMEDITEEPVLDIDGSDANNPLAVVDYIDDLHASYRKLESLGSVSPDYMEQQDDITAKMRAILIDWLIEVQDKFELMKETLFLTVNLIDRFLSKQKVERKKLQLVGLVAMLLACKYEEVSVPVVGDLVLISDKAYSRKEILHMEKLMLSTLQFNMSFPTPYVFMQRFLKATQCDNKKLEMLSFFLIELSLVEYEMIKYPPSLMAAAAVYTAQCNFYGFKQWSSTCEWHTNYSELQLLECSRKMVGFHEKAGTGKLTGVYRKYNTSKYGYTSRCEAAVFLLENEEDAS